MPHVEIKCFSGRTDEQKSKILFIIWNTKSCSLFCTHEQDNKQDTWSQILLSREKRINEFV